MDINHLKTWIGNQETASEQLTPSLVSRFGATFDMSCSTNEGESAPSLIHLCLCAPAIPTSELGADGHPKRGGFLPPVPLPNRMWAGGEFKIAGNILIGDVITRRSTIKDIYLKEGQSGPLCFVVVEHNIKSGNKHALTEIHNIVYKAPQKNNAKEISAAPRGTYTEDRTPTAPLLFRYSALTFNGHRIHYDAPYAKDTEGYPGLIVHGPLQATLLFQLAEKLKGAKPSHFIYRNLSTIFDTTDFTLHADESGDMMTLWTSQKDGPVAMKAEANW